MASAESLSKELQEFFQNFKAKAVNIDPLPYDVAVILEAYDRFTDAKDYVEYVNKFHQT